MVHTHSYLAENIIDIFVNTYNSSRTITISNYIVNISFLASGGLYSFNIHYHVCSLKQPASPYYFYHFLSMLFIDGVDHLIELIQATHVLDFFKPSFSFLIFFLSWIASISWQSFSTLWCRAQMLICFLSSRQFSQLGM